MFLNIVSYLCWIYQKEERIDWFVFSAFELSSVVIVGLFMLIYCCS